MTQVSHQSPHNGSVSPVDPVVPGHRAAAGPLAFWPLEYRAGIEGDCHLPAFCRSVSSVPAWSAADPPADLSVGDPEDQGLRVKVGRPEGQQVFERRTSKRAPLAPEAWKVTSYHRRSAASERRSSPSRSTAQIATSTRPRLSAAWVVPRGSAFSGFAWRCGWGVGPGQPGQR